MDDQAVIAATRRWISSMVIGLNLCPFAERVFKADLIRYVVSAAEDEANLLVDLTRELEALATRPISEVETTLLIHQRKRHPRRLQALARLMARSHREDHPR